MHVDPPICDAQPSVRSPTLPGTTPAAGPIQASYRIRDPEGPVALRCVAQRP